MKNGIKTLAMWLIIGVIFIVVLSSIVENSDSKLKYSELITNINAGNVEAIEIEADGTTATVTLKDERVKKAFWFCVRTATAAMTVIGVGGYFFADEIVRIFRRDDLLLIEIAVKALRFQCITLPLTGFVVMSNMFLQNTRKTVRATVVAMARQGIMFIPSLFLLSAYYGLTGIQLSQSAADILSLVLAIPLTISAIKEMKTTDGLQV